jgi:hypothetical protein
MIDYTVCCCIRPSKIDLLVPISLPNLIKHRYLVTFYEYSGTCLERPPLNARIIGLSRQVVSHQRFILQIIRRVVFSFCGLSSEGGLSSERSLKTGSTVLCYFIYSIWPS